MRKKRESPLRKNLGGEKKKKMKTKNKMLALVEIAVVLFSVFLVALPVMAIAAEQTPQKVSASEVTTASEEDYVLGVYGNANEDDTIDMRDLTYVKLIFFGKKTVTELADAKYDGKINPLDFIQIKLIIVGKEKELTVVDSAGKIITLSMPLERIIAGHSDAAEVIRILGAEDKVVGVTTSVEKETVFLPKLSKKPSVGYYDIEIIIELVPDMVIAYTTTKPEKLDDKLPTTIKVVRLDFYRQETEREELEKIGYLLGNREKAREFIKWYSKYIAEIKEGTSKIPEDRRVKVYLDASWGMGELERKTYAKGSGVHEICTLAGGRNIAANLETPYPKVETEWILKENPDIIIGLEGGRKAGYEINDNKKITAHYDNIIGLAGFNNITAVKNDKVYIIWSEMAGWGPCNFIGLAYMAKWFYPDLFGDLDPQALHQEYLDKFCGIDFDVGKQGVFVYPEPS